MNIPRRESRIPLIDMDPFLQGSEEQRREVADEFYEAAHEVGFLYLKNFGIEPQFINEAFQLSQSFFGSNDKHTGLCQTLRYLNNPPAVVQRPDNWEPASTRITEP